MSEPTAEIAEHDPARPESSALSAVAPHTAMLGMRRHIPELAIGWALDAPERNWRILEGTLCFADVSGFTALAERLALRGRQGGEELVGRLGGVFGTMLDLAAERGGMLLKFGGDALLLFFQGPDHALQAASAAVAMRQALRAAAATPTSVGPLKLSMSVGLHSGAAHFYLVGSSHRELVLLGPAADAVVATETAANAGEIALSPATVALLPQTATKLRDDGLPLLRWRRPPVPACGPHPQREASEELLRGLFPRVLGEFLAAGAPEPEHRVACMAFIRFSGTDALLTRGGPDAVAAALDATVSAAQQCLDEEAVTLLAIDVDHDGGKLFLGSGVPYAQEDDEGNMLRALRRIADFDLPLTLQMGVNRGHVFAAEVGSRTRAAYSAMGDTTNTAARITGKAPAGVIFAHPSVLDESLAVFSVEPAPPLTLKGKRAPLVVYQIGAATGTRRREGLTVAEFFGRQAELGALSGAVAQVRDGGGSVWSITADAGMGKSRLIQEALAGARDLPTLAMRGEPHGASGAYGMFREPLSSLLGLSDGDEVDRAARLLDAVGAAAPELLPVVALLGEAVGVELDATPEVASIEPRFRAARTADALVRLLAGRHPGPLICVVDDAQWCDESSAVLLKRLVRAADEHPWLVLIARRPGNGGVTPDPAATELTLGPMAPEAVKALVRIATEAAPLRPHELDLVVERAGGNPLFALEILRNAREIGSFDAVPQSLEAAMAAQVDALDTQARRLLRYASVLGRSFSREVLNEALRLEGQLVEEATLARLEAFLEEDGAGRLRFRSGVICDTTYESVSYQMRRRLHRNVAETLERMAADPAVLADVLALHFSRAEDHAKTWHYAKLAADSARDRYANAEAARYFALALDMIRRLPEVSAEQEIEVLTRLGQARERVGLLEDSLDAFSRAVRLAGDDSLNRARLLAHRASIKERTRNFAGAVRDLRLGIRLLDQQPSVASEQQRATLEKNLAWLFAGQDRPAKALRQARLAADRARAVGELRALGGALIVLDMAGLMVEGPGPGDNLREALKIFESLEDLSMLSTVHANLGVLCAIAGRWNEGVRYFEAARGLCNRIGDVTRGADPSVNLGEMLVKQRRFDEAEPVLREAIEVLRASHAFINMNRGEIQLARILIERGAFEEADALLVRVERQFRDAGQHLAALEAATVRALGCLRAGRPNEALAQLDEARRATGAAADLLLPVVACERALILSALEDYQAAWDQVVAGLEAARVQGLPYEVAMLTQIKADIAGRTDRNLPPGEAETAQGILNDLGIR